MWTMSMTSAPVPDWLLDWNMTWVIRTTISVPIENLTYIRRITLPIPCQSLSRIVHHVEPGRTVLYCAMQH